MALVEEYYELNEAEVVPVAWKVIQIGAYVFAGCLGLWCGYTMALVRLKFDDKCYLFTKAAVDKSCEITTAIDWENDFWCDYCQYTMVTTFMLSTIWATLFLMCGKGGKSLTGLPQPWRIVLCSLIFNVIYFSLVLSASIKIQQGTEAFCDAPKFLGSQPTLCLHECLPLPFIHDNENLIRMTFSQLEIIVKTSWACTLVWLILILLSFFRIFFVVDFRMYKICVFQIDETIHNKKEEVLKITNYEEPKKLYIMERKDNIVDYLTANKSKEDLEKGKRSEMERRRLNMRAGQGQLEPNSTFYVTADIRMLSREKKRKNIKVLDEAFERNQALRSKKFMYPDEAQMTMDEPGGSHPMKLLYRSPRLDIEQMKKNDYVDSEHPRKVEARWESSSDESALENKSAIFKKQV